jgi:anaerobic selenocysteine-containing dehydrogenase
MSWRPEKFCYGGKCMKLSNNNEVVKSICGLCFSSHGAGCSVSIHLSGGKAVKVEGDSGCPICLKGLESLEYLYNQYRLKHPFKRIGKRGEGKWEQITWDEALEVIAKKLIEIKGQYGPESICMVRGAAKGIQDYLLTRFANAFEIPNVVSMASICFQPNRLAQMVTYGFLSVNDFEYPPNCIVAWGVNRKETRISKFQKLSQALERGAKLVVIDPLQTELARKANLWIQPRPGSDLALALGMIKIILDEGLFDKTFVDNWTVGFDELAVHVSDYPISKVEEMTWVDASKIKELARFYATNKPASIESGNGIEQNVNSFQTVRAISILRAITGNLGVPGGDLQMSGIQTLRLGSPKFNLSEKISKEKRKNGLAAQSKLLPLVDTGTPQSLIKAILDGDPYPIRAVYVQGCNPLLTYPNANATYRAFKKLDFLAVADMFMTPTAALADIVLPVTSYLEYDGIVLPPAYPIAQVQQKVAQIGECRSDPQILNGLAKKLELEKYFWEDDEKCLDTILKPAGLTFKEFRKIGTISGTKQYRRHEVQGFETNSHKVELFSTQLKEWGFDPLPTYKEPPETPFSNPGLVKEYPLIFISWKSEPYRHSSGRQMATLRGIHPDPVIYIHPETAIKLGIKEGDWVYVETKRGKIKQKASLTTCLDPRVVGIDYAWWFPEKDVSDLYGWAISNINILTDNNPPYNQEVGSTNLRGILCKVYKAL